MKVFIDTNLILDVLAERKPFYENSRSIWALAETGAIQAFLSVTSLTDIFYVVKKHLGAGRAREILRDMMHVFGAVSVGKRDIDKALRLDIHDFEDAVQWICASKIKARYLFTRNLKDFPKKSPELEAVLPESFLRLWMRRQDSKKPEP